MTDSKTTVVGDYEIIDSLGGGGQGRVFKARCTAEHNKNVSMGEIVALKRLHRGGDYATESVVFKRAVEIFSNLKHPNIVRYRESFIEQDEWGDDLYYQVMDFLDGEDLSSVIEKHPSGIPWPQVENIFTQLLDALMYATNQGVVHRDIKPSNIFVMPDGSVRIIDFGIARVEEAAGSTLSSTGPRGSYDYMAPEFVRMENFRGDEQSDVFSLGVCFYEALTGSLPFKDDAAGATGFVMRWSAVGDKKATTPASAIKVLNARATEMLSKVLAEEREERCPTFREMRDMLGKVRQRGVHSEKATYMFTDYLGKGGFGEVFLGERKGDGKRYAVKRLYGHHDPGRFLREAMVLKEHPHDHIVRYEDFVHQEETGDYYIIMELLEGMPEFSLRERIRDVRAEGRGLEVGEVRELFAGYLSALGYLHSSKGSDGAAKPVIIHRDITPANLYAPLGNPGEGKIFDLGIVLSQDWTALTVGRPPGNPEYLAPEFLTEGFRGSRQSDVYSLGLCLYEALTGQHAYPRLPKDVSKMWPELLKRARGEVRINFDHIVFQGNPDLKYIVQKASALEQTQRFSSARHMLDVLEQGVTHEEFCESNMDTMQGGLTEVLPDDYTVDEEPTTRRRRRARPRKQPLLGRILAGVVVLVLVAGTIALIISRRPSALQQKARDYVRTCGRFEPTAAYVQGLKRGLAEAETWYTRHARDRDVAQALTALSEACDDVGENFEASFAAYLEKRNITHAESVIDEWQDVAAQLPINRLGPQDHLAATKSMKERLAFIRNLPPSKMEFTVSNLRLLEGALDMLYGQLKDAEPRYENWWKRQEKRLTSQVDGLSRLNEDAFDGLLSADLPQADKMAAALLAAGSTHYVRELMSERYDSGIAAMEEAVNRYVREKIGGDEARLLDWKDTYPALDRFGAEAYAELAEAIGLQKKLLARARQAVGGVQQIAGMLASADQEAWDTAVQQWKALELRRSVWEQEPLMVELNAMQSGFRGIVEELIGQAVDDSVLASLEGNFVAVVDGVAPIASLREPLLAKSAARREIIRVYAQISELGTQITVAEQDAIVPLARKLSGFAGGEALADARAKELWLGAQDQLASRLAGLAENVPWQDRRKRLIEVESLIKSTQGLDILTSDQLQHARESLSAALAVCLLRTENNSGQPMAIEYADKTYSLESGATSDIVVQVSSDAVAIVARPGAGYMPQTHQVETVGGGAGTLVIAAFDPKPRPVAVLGLPDEPPASVRCMAAEATEYMPVADGEPLVPGRYVFLFERPDFKAVETNVVLEIGEGPVSVSAPAEWMLTERVGDLVALERSLLDAESTDGVAEIYRKCRSVMQQLRDVEFEWPPHQERYEAAKQKFEGMGHQWGLAQAETGKEAWKRGKFKEASESYSDAAARLADIGDARNQVRCAFNAAAAGYLGAGKKQKRLLARQLADLSESVEGMGIIRKVALDYEQMAAKGSGLASVSAGLLAAHLRERAPVDLLEEP